jgi:hypothetical protein
MVIAESASATDQGAAGEHSVRFGIVGNRFDIRIVRFSDPFENGKLVR